MAEYLLAHLLVAAAPVVMLASFVAVSRVASNTSRRVVGQWGGAGGACCEDHLASAGRSERLRGNFAQTGSNKSGFPVLGNLLDR